jgi:anaerobic selenocysteine-containing dehydrogenase
LAFAPITPKQDFFIPTGILMSNTTIWKPTACILCSENCGLEVQVQDGHLTTIRGDKNHPTSRGYLCEKAAALDFYQNHVDRLSHPLRRRPDGTLEEIPWDTAIREIADAILRIRGAYGGNSLAYYGGAGQGNQLHLPYGVGLRFAMQSPYMYHALGQEKTGEFWLDGELYGSQACHTSRDITHSDFVLLSGTNPWHAHGFPRARKVLHEISYDPNRTLVVIDPRRTETAELADIHLQVRPGADAFLFAAMIATIVQEGLQDREFLERHTTGYERLAAAFADIPVDRYAQIAGVQPADVRRVARGFAAARSACVRSDLGLQQSFHSTLNLYLEKLVYLITGNLGNRGGVTFHAHTIPLLWHSDRNAPNWDSLKTRVAGAAPIAGFYPINGLPGEIDTDHPGRLRGLVVDSANPAVSSADTSTWRRALRKLELLVVIDTAFSETAELAHYVLPAASQFEKYECTFFNWGFPENHLHVRHPVLGPRNGTLPEQEIYSRLVAAMKEDVPRNPLLGPIESFKASPQVQRLTPAFRAPAAPLLMASHGFVEQHREAVLRAGIEDRGEGLPAALFERIVSSPSGAVISIHEYEDTFRFIRHPDGKVHLAIEEMLEWLDGLRREAEAPPAISSDFPLMLSAGERRTSNALSNYRNPAWRRTDPNGSLRINPADAARLGIVEGEEVVCESTTGSVSACAHVDDSVQPGAVSLPHGFGLKYPRENGQRLPHGPLVNMLTALDHCDPMTKVPYHKNVPVRLRKVPSAS